ncbi:hypothetical protein GOP47_0002036 [Adiantum capillus-veneris]|uniref:NAC domain-containing protein n=1 Tax=Adiantum capillus-veneris TaxID=13818 RepID=A0A9D4VAX6_ADICA|nr:hypothetical protein GOP47_0002036 [Adiantum capillus-veneris]
MNNMDSASNMSSMLNMRGAPSSTSCSAGGGSGLPSHLQHQRQQLDLPPGFRFHPTDEELVVHYLKNKVSSRPLPVPIIAEIDLYKFDPWDLPGKAICGENEWYFFTPRDRKYPNGARPNRAAGSGYWKATGTDKPISTSMQLICANNNGSNNNNMHLGGFQAHHQHVKLGVKKALVFYKGRPPKGVKTNWIMHEYRLAPDPSSSKPPSFSTRRSLRLDDWVLCRIYRKCSQASRAHTGSEANSCVEEVLAGLPDHEQHNLQADEVDAASVHIYNHTRQLPRFGSLGRLIMGSMSDPFLDSLVTDQISTSNHVSHQQIVGSHLPTDPQSSWTNLAHLDTSLSASTINNPNSLFARIDSDPAHKRSPLATAPMTLTNVDNMALNIGLSSIFPSMQSHQHHHPQQQQQQPQQQQQQQQQAPCDDTNTSGGDVADSSNIRWPFSDVRSKFPFA